jgi:hypothetical protein
VETIEVNDVQINIKDIVGGVCRGGKVFNPILRSTAENRPRGRTPRGGTPRGRGKGTTPRGGRHGSQSRRTSIGIEDLKPPQKDGRKWRTPGTVKIDKSTIVPRKSAK